METAVKDSFSLTGEVMVIKSRDGVEISRTPWMKNKVVASDSRGVFIILDRLAGTNVYTGNITHADIGTGAVAANELDTGLGNAVTRASIGAVSRSGKQVEFRFFYPNAVTPNNTYTEFGMYIDGGATLSSGRLFNRILFTTSVVKTTGEDHTIVCRVTATV